MWAVESGKIKPEVDRDVVYYRMASAFGFWPEIVDAMNSDRVESLLFLDQQVQEKEKKLRESNKDGRHF